jgi:hypothetical protein
MPEAMVVETVRSTIDHRRRLTWLSRMPPAGPIRSREKNHKDAKNQ